MIINSLNPSEKRKALRECLSSGKLLQMPGAFNAMVAMIIEELDYDGVYISGGVMANTLGLPDIGLTTLSEVAQMAQQIAKMTKLPVIMDIDTGFGEVMNVARTIEEIEFLGLAGCHMEDQINPKRCGHLDNKGIVSVQEMCKKIKAAVKAKKDDNFLLIARTDANASEGLEKTIERTKAYVDAGADMIFPEALSSEKQFEVFREAVDVPLLANMTEFGKSKLLDYDTLQNLGYNIVIYPVTTQRLAMQAVEEGLKHIKDHGSQDNIVDKMQTRKRLYEVVKYKDYEDFDSDVFNFKL
jgi:methylisocitrate lyase